jgi:hypothetical protein
MKPVMLMDGRLHPDLDTAAEYEFRRGTDGEPFVGRYRDFHPMFNIWGLYFTPLPSSVVIEG